MRVRFLGTGGYHPNARRHTACVLLPELGLAFDCGTSAFRLAEHVVPKRLQVVLSHAHLDHICGLTYLLVPLLTGRWEQLAIYGTPETLTAVRTHLFDKAIFPVLLDQMTFHELPEQLVMGDVTICHTALTHPGGCCGFRLERSDGKSLAYITDTTVDGSYTEFIRGVDVLIHECNFPDDLQQWCQLTGHSHTSMVAQLARDAEVGRLYLTHIDPQRPDDDPLTLAVAQAIFPQTYYAEDGLEIQL